jgi:hypothetical protein
MGNLTLATLFIVTVNVLTWFCQIAMLDINPNGSICYNLEGSIIDSSTTRTGNYSVVDNDVVGDLPTSAGTITPSSSTSSFTDIFNNVLTWFKSAPGIKYIYGVVAAPYNLLKCTNLPSSFIVGIGTLWYLVSFLVLIAFIWGRD